MSPDVPHPSLDPPDGRSRRRARSMTTGAVAVAAFAAAWPAAAEASADPAGERAPFVGAVVRSGVEALRPPGATVRSDGRTVRFVDRRVARATRRLTGELVGVSEGRQRYVLQTASGRQVPVSFRGRALPARAVGARVRIRAGASGRVRTATFTTRLRKAATATPTAHRAYVALVSNKGSFGSGDATIKSTIDTALGRWREESNGAISSFTRVETKQLATTTDCSSGSAMYNEAASKLFPGISTGSTSGNHVIVISPPGCAGGVGTVQAGIASGGRLNAGWNPRSTLQTLMHELGHNFSLSHANACYEPLGPSCQVQQYANTYALMGYTLSNDPAYTPAALDSFERSRLGITDPGEIAPVTLAAGRRTTTSTYDLRARGATAGLRGLRITDPTTGTVYSVDWRSGGGRDAGSAYALHPGRTIAGITVQRITDEGRAAAVLGHANPDPSKAAVLGLAAGRSFSAGGVRIVVESTGEKTDPTATSRIGVTLTDPSVTEQPPAPAEPVLSGRAYEIVNAGSRRVVDNPGSSFSEGRQLIQYQATGNPNQRWTFTRNADGTYAITNGTSRMCMDVAGSATGDGGRIIQWGCSGSANQRWTIAPSGEGFRLAARHSGRCLTVPGGSTADGTQLTQAACTTSAAQRWTFAPAS